MLLLLLGVESRRRSHTVRWDARRVGSSVLTAAETEAPRTCLPAQEWIKMCCTHAVEYYSAMREDILPAVTWVNLGDIMLSEMCQARDKYMFSLICGV